MSKETTREGKMAARGRKSNTPKGKSPGSVKKTVDMLVLYRRANFTLPGTPESEAGPAAVWCSYRLYDDMKPTPAFWMAQAMLATTAVTWGNNRIRGKINRTVGNCGRRRCQVIMFSGGLIKPSFEDVSAATDTNFGRSTYSAFWKQVYEEEMRISGAVASIKYMSEWREGTDVICLPWPEKYTDGNAPGDYARELLESFYGPGAFYDYRK
jgi:hypothetical protein